MKRILLGGIVALGAAAAVGNRTPELAAAVATPFIENGSCILLCVDTPAYCSPQDHDAWWFEYGGYEYRDGYHSINDPCWIGTCHDKHPPCEPDWLTVENLEALRNAIADEDVVAFGQIIDVMGDTAVRVDHERSAVQLLGCDGSPLAHIPLSTSLVRSVGE